jgi:hypothetical protein
MVLRITRISRSTEWSRETTTPPKACAVAELHEKRM